MLGIEQRSYFVVVVGEDTFHQKLTRTRLLRIKKSKYMVSRVWMLQAVSYFTFRTATLSLQTRIPSPLNSAEIPSSCNIRLNSVSRTSPTKTDGSYFAELWVMASREGVVESVGKWILPVTRASS